MIQRAIKLYFLDLKKLTKFNGKKIIIKIFIFKNIFFIFNAELSALLNSLFSL